MSTSIRRTWLGVTALLIAAFALFAATAAEEAGATEVLPSQNAVNTTATATLDSTQFSWFIPGNAYLPAGVGCTTATADILIPPSQLNPATGYFSQNQNKANTGTHSDDSGSVIADLDEPPTFANCAVYDLDTVADQHAQDYTRDDPPDVLVPDVTVDTSGGWTVSLDNINGTDVVAAVGVPAHGAVINIPTGSGTKCALSVTGTAAGNKAQSALADFYNGDEETDARLEVDTQLKYTEDASSTTGHCAAISVPVTSPTTGDATSQFEADFVVTSNQGPVRVIP